ncbi:hypothetical protein IW262DRAFT_1302044 [Armillaria fumosa]|nr:hypothetical protein IW262DRAFT_1302044 [Armillaria fumosa]
MTSSVSLNAHSTHSRSQLLVLNTGVADSMNLTSTRSCRSLATVGEGTVLVQPSVSQAPKPTKDNTKLTMKLGGSSMAKEGELIPGRKENVDKGKKANTLGVRSTSGSSSSIQADHMASTQGCHNLEKAKETTGDDPQTMPNMPMMEMMSYALTPLLGVAEASQKRKPDEGDLETDDTYAPGSNSFAALIMLDVGSSIVSPVVAPGGQGDDSVAEGPEEALNEDLTKAVKAPLGEALKLYTNMPNLQLRIVVLDRVPKSNKHFGTPFIIYIRGLTPDQKARVVEKLLKDVLYASASIRTFLMSNYDAIPNDVSNDRVLARVILSLIACAYWIEGRNGGLGCQAWNIWIAHPTRVVVRHQNWIKELFKVFPIYSADGFSGTTKPLTYPFFCQGCKGGNHATVQCSYQKILELGAPLRADMPEDKDEGMPSTAMVVMG